MLQSVLAETDWWLDSIALIDRMEKLVFLTELADRTAAVAVLFVGQMVMEMMVPIDQTVRL